MEQDDIDEDIDMSDENIMEDMDSKTMKSDEEGSEMGEKIHLNTASKEKLAAIPGVGEKTAQAIIDYRKKKGKFKTIEELANVKNIKEENVQELKKLLTL